MRKIALAVAVAALGVATLAQAGGTMKPGMWSYTGKMDAPGMPMQMPPMSYQHCLTQDDIDHHKQYKSDRDKDCEISNMKQDGGHVSFDMTCKNGTTSHADYQFGEDSMNGKTVTHMAGKHPMDMTMNMSAKRTGDCK